MDLRTTNLTAARVRNPIATSELGLVVLWPTGWQDYGLIDSGEGRKLERFGSVIVDRPEASALWRRRSPKLWPGADLVFDEAWRVLRPPPEPWIVRCPPVGLSAHLAMTPFRHVGIFPEQAAHWEWMTERLRARSTPARVLVLFGYTGLTTLSLASAGAHVTHVDASRPAMMWARRNCATSGLVDRPIRWLIDDALAFVRREGRRRALYDGIVLDPPAFGRGPQGELWRFENDIAALLGECRKVLSPDAAFLLLNAYAVIATGTLLANLLADVRSDGRIEAGELCLSGGGRILPTGLFARWSPG